MTRRRTPGLLALTLLTFALIASTAAAAGGGRLSAFEYQQLASARARVKKAASLQAGIFDCQQIQMRSSLLTSERADCISQLQLGSFGVQMRSYETRCSADRAARARLRCLLPAYLRFSRADTTFDAAEARIHRIALARGLGARCANLLSDPPVVLARERVAQRAIESIIRAIRAANVLNFEAASGQAMTALVEVAKGQQTNRGSLAICPHQ